MCERDHLEQHFNHPKLAKLQKGTLAKWFLDKVKQFNETYQTITRILQNRKKLTVEMNTRFRTAKPSPIRTLVLLTNQQQIEGVSKTYTPQVRRVLSLPFYRILLELSYGRLNKNNNLKAYLTN